MNAHKIYAGRIVEKNNRPENIERLLSKEKRKNSERRKKKKTKIDWNQLTSPCFETFTYILSDDKNTRNCKLFIVN